MWICSYLVVFVAVAYMLKQFYSSAWKFYFIVSSKDHNKFLYFIRLHFGSNNDLPLFSPSNKNDDLQWIGCLITLLNVGQITKPQKVFVGE